MRKWMLAVFLGLAVTLAVPPSQTEAVGQPRAGTVLVQNATGAEGSAASPSADTPAGSRREWAQWGVLGALLIGTYGVYFWRRRTGGVKEYEECEADRDGDGAHPRSPQY